MNWSAFLIFAFVTVYTPGPNTIMSMTNGSRLGFRRSLPFIGGVWLGLTVIMLLSAVFCSVVSALIPKIVLPMRIVGAGYILFLAWKVFRGGKIEEREEKSSFLSGLLLQFVNVKIYLYGIVCMQSYILPVYAGQTGLLIGFALLLGVIALSSNLCWAAFGSVFRRLMEKHSRLIRTVLALLLVYCALSLLLSQAQ